MVNWKITYFSPAETPSCTLPDSEQVSDRKSNAYCVIGQNFVNMFAYAASAVLTESVLLPCSREVNDRMRFD